MSRLVPKESARNARSRLSDTIPPRPTMSASTVRSAQRQLRHPRKIRYTDAEWSLITERARTCGRPPARYVREISLGIAPKVRNNPTLDGFIHELGRVGTSLSQVARSARASGHGTHAEAIESVVFDLLSMVRRLATSPTNAREPS